MNKIISKIKVKFTKWKTRRKLEPISKKTALDLITNVNMGELSDKWFGGGFDITDIDLFFAEFGKRVSFQFFSSDLKKSYYELATYRIRPAQVLANRPLMVNETNIFTPLSFIRSLVDSIRLELDPTHYPATFTAKLKLKLTPKDESVVGNDLELMLGFLTRVSSVSSSRAQMASTNIRQVVDPSEYSKEYTDTSKDAEITLNRLEDWLRMSIFNFEYDNITFNRKYTKTITITIVKTLPNRKLTTVDFSYNINL